MRLIVRFALLASDGGFIQLGMQAGEAFAETLGCNGLKEDNMKTLHCLVVTVLLTAIAGGQAQAQGYPNKPVRIIIDSAPGSTVDVVTRVFADKLGEFVGAQLVTVNQPGGGGSIAARLAATSPPDGYTLYSPAASVFATLPGAAPNLPLHLPRDFLPIGFVSEQPMFIAATAESGITSLAELIALAKSHPGEVAYAVTGRGRITHLTGELLQSRTGIKLLNVPYTGGPAQALNDALGGRISIVIEGFPGIASAVQGGALKPIAVASRARLAEFPNLPTVAETIPDFFASGWQLLVAPLGVPADVVPKLSPELRKTADDGDVRRKLAPLGGYPRAMSPEETVAFVEAEQKRWQPILDQIAQQPQ